mmetsp:Transcript_57097/g.122835  ORF Transcript_57097/g.122835 Transcript_57097/m.122835 type:complete len:238 (+) Transcript_57097:148-861(+)
MWARRWSPCAEPSGCLRGSCRTSPLQSPAVWQAQPSGGPLAGATFMRLRAWHSCNMPHWQRRTRRSCTSTAGFLTWRQQLKDRDRAGVSVTLGRGAAGEPLYTRTSTWSSSQGLRRMQMASMAFEGPYHPRRGAAWPRWGMTIGSASRSSSGWSWRVSLRSSARASPRWPLAIRPEDVSASWQGKSQRVGLLRRRLALWSCTAHLSLQRRTCRQRRRQTSRLVSWVGRRSLGSLPSC